MNIGYASYRLAVSYRNHYDRMPITHMNIRTSNEYTWWCFAIGKMAIILCYSFTIGMYYVCATETARKTINENEDL